jgi:hypothetical protein
MGKLTKVHVGYELKDPAPPFVDPGMRLEGRIVVTNNGEKPLKLKEIYILQTERWDEDDGEGYGPRKSNLNNYYLSSQGVINPGETQYYPFSIVLSTWKRKRGKRISGWHVALFFKQKTKMVASRGSIKRNATCILPVFGTMIAPSFGDPTQLTGKKKKRRK